MYGLTPDKERQMSTTTRLRRPEVTERRPTLPGVEARGVILVRCGKTGRPKFDLPMCMYPSWAQAEFRKMLTPAEIAEFFGA